MGAARGGAAGCGLIFHELVTHALKYAFAPGAGARWGSLGLRLVSLWATYQLGGRLEMKFGPGTAFTVEFETGRGGVL